MSSYKITEYTYNQAKRLGVQIKPSSNPKKKIDVFKDGKLISRVGGMRPNGVPYGDYPTYVKGEREGKFKKNSARIRQILYKKRFAKDIEVVGSDAWWNSNLLW
jgi:hypothetical protein